MNISFIPSMPNVFSLGMIENEHDWILVLLMVNHLFSGAFMPSAWHD